MVGKLARLMRMLGFDTLYFNQIEDSELIDISLKEKRTIVTRDTKLIERVMVQDYILVENDNPERQLIEFLDKSGLQPDESNFLSCCLECNAILEYIPKEKIKDQVWQYTFQTHEEFKICPECRRVYWEGDHVKAMRKKLINIGIFESD
ncbi:MAG: hypothetical protein GWO41_11050 [candidate division Zixibacteria bacterium]|nr:hypothetical protein [candidate division Zixibacteria bacterium]NIS16851.1 hypothetical protein [candidate division Zixibacteria bacterium]NIS49286.1 hypothetical protein [candidate division Zixibacteria bacterium]NIT53253.1 hypothetical protein [candidate division Zixibacteria bacterium]NIU13265.1 hypothetical protein [candidate division Zixibacteria bacterium]